MQNTSELLIRNTTNQTKSLGVDWEELILRFPNGERLTIYMDYQNQHLIIRAGEGMLRILPDSANKVAITTSVLLGTEEI